MLNIIVAPRSHNPKGEKHVKKIVKFLKTRKEEFSVYFLRSMQDLATNVKEITSCGEYEFVIVGDDIVVHEFINSVKDISKIKLGIVPTGKNEDFASYVGISHKPVQAIKDIIEKNIVQTDLLLINNNIRSLNNVVVGASVEILEKYSQFKIKNALSEKIAIAKYAGKYNGEHLTISTKNGKVKSETVYEFVAANGGKSKGKLVSPLSNIHDGLINVSYSLLSDKSENIKNLKLFNKGKHIYNDNTKQHWLNNIKLVNETNQIKAGIDGKIYTLDKLDITLIENGLKLYKTEN